jgi:hypothetical protein
MNAVLVRARFGYEMRDAGQRWRVEKGDLGVLQWRPHRRHRRFLEPMVVWDNDPDHVPRQAILSSLRVVGLQTKDTRVYLAARPRQG